MLDFQEGKRLIVLLVTSRRFDRLHDAGVATCVIDVRSLSINALGMMTAGEAVTL